MDSKNDTVSKLIDECFKALDTVDERGKPVRWYEDSRHGVYCILDDDDSGDGLIATAVERVRIRPAMDSGAADHVIHPRELPNGAFIAPNTTGNHFRGADNTVI